MRYSSRLLLLLVVQIAVVFYFSWTLVPLHVHTQIQDAWTHPSNRVVIFGDSWSDTGEYLVSPPPGALIEARDADRGDIWTEVLCKELLCDRIDNFARSMPSDVAIRTIGALVDSDIYTNATVNQQAETLFVFDFKSQVQQFLSFEQQKTIRGHSQDTSGKAVFTVFFGIWDIWEYSTLDTVKALQAVDRSIDELIHNLNLLVEHVGEIVVVIPKVLDVTFLPQFRFGTRETVDAFAQNQHQYVYLCTYWNTALSQAAKEWRGGQIFMPELNNMVMNQVRATQLYSMEITDASGLGRPMPLFENVEQPCILEPVPNEGDKLQATGVEKCLEPDHHLFWDKMHLSGPAHRLIGEHAARLVHGNFSVNIRSREHANDTSSATTQKSDMAHTPAFELRMPPGY